MAATHLDALLARFHKGISDATDRAALADALVEAGRDDLAARVRSVGATEMTAAARAFLEDVEVAWDSLDPYLATAEAGHLAEPDADRLRDLCEEEDAASDHADSEADVMLYVMGHVACAQVREAANE